MSKATKSRKISAIIDNKVGNYEKHPFFVKKAGIVKALTKAVGLPKEIQNFK